MSLLCYFYDYLVPLRKPEVQKLSITWEIQLFKYGKTLNK